MKIFVKSFFVSIAISLIALLILSILLAKTSVNESIMPIGIIFISSASVLVGGYMIGKNKKTKGIVYGACFGFCYMVVLYLISSIQNLNFIINLEAIFMILAGVLRRNDRRNFRCKFIKKSAKSS